MHAPKIMLVAGEASGDLNGAYLAKEILRKRPQARLFGMGGDLMKEANVRLLYNPTSISTLGFIEALKSAQILRRVLLRLGEIVDRQQPDVVVLIDFPGFNMRFAEILKRKGIPCVYYFSPSAWAWGKDRANKVAETVNKVISIFPFEYEVYKEAGADVEYVGHPLLDIVPARLAIETAKANLGLDEAQPIVAVLPGSRRQEIKGLLPIMLKSVRILQKAVPDIKAVIPAAHASALEEIKRITSDSDIDTMVVSGQAHEVLNAAEVALIANGTAVLEAALLDVPQVVIYRTSYSTYFAAKMILKIPRVALPNIICDDEIVPELLQNEAVPEKIGAELTKLWQPEARKRMLRDYTAMRERLGESGAISRAAQLVIEAAEAEMRLKKAGS
ncbi:MAG: lipid-A-disaccharide synthase [Firmicutes bacterium]|nr:lipid-A-disaccharide synthase [Bacillota bacterium]